MNLADIFEITPEVKELVRSRLLSGRNLATRRGVSPETKKLVLMIVERIAPYTVFSQAEAALLHGISLPALRNRLRDPVQHPRRLNIGK